eukprot:GHUV01006102.1.p1 GENE.GHUV01006102.1~~GHUV01006102.1.p1  ORF type:complete len:198 (+),score=57.51 GHUV01006102.1:319-912(+)
MYPALPGANDPPSRPAYGYGNLTPPAPNSNSYGAAPPQASQLTGQGSLDNSPWSNETNSTLRVKIADDYKLAPPVPMPPALAASSQQQQDFDYEFERQVISADASTSFDAFLAKPEETYYHNTKASRFIEAGHPPAAVNLALAYFAANRGDESQIKDFCESFKTLTEMSFSTSLAAGALVKTKTDVAAAVNLLAEIS